MRATIIALLLLLAGCSPSTLKSREFRVLDMSGGRDGNCEIYFEDSYEGIKIYEPCNKWKVGDSVTFQPYRHDTSD